MVSFRVHKPMVSHMWKLRLWIARRSKLRKIDPDVIPTRNLLIWSQTRYRCATEPLSPNGRQWHSGPCYPTSGRTRKYCTKYWVRKNENITNVLCIPYFNWYSTVWLNNSQTHLHKLYELQKRAGIVRTIRLDLRILLKSSVRNLMNFNSINGFFQST